MELIDKNTIIAEIDRRISNFKNEKSKDGASKMDRLSLGARIASLEEFKVFINTLELKKVDFETAFAASIDHFDEKNNYGQWPESDLRQFAKHFFELGVKTQNGE